MTDVRTLSTEDLRQRLGEGNELRVWNVQTDQIVTYCGGPQCPQSREAAETLTALGFTDVRVYTDGLQGWKTAGYEVVQASQPVPAA